MNWNLSRFVSVTLTVFYAAIVLALVFILVLLLAELARSLGIMVGHFGALSKQDVVLTSLALLDLALLGFLVLSIAEALIFRATHWLGTRVMIVIVAISSIGLLQNFLDTSNQMDWVKMIGLHTAFLITTLAVAWIERRAQMSTNNVPVPQRMLR